MVGFLLGWFVRQAERQRKAVKAIREVGGHVWYDYQLDDSGRPAAKHEPPALAWLRELTGEDLLSDVHNVFVPTPVTDSCIEDLRVLTEIECLIIYGTHVTGAELRRLKGLRDLDKLVLFHTKIRDEGYENLKGLTQLKCLSVEGSYVTYDDIRELQEALPICKIEFTPPDHP